MRVCLIEPGDLWNQPNLTSVDFPHVLKEYPAETITSRVVLACSNDEDVVLSMLYGTTFHFITIRPQTTERSAVKINTTCIFAMLPQSIMEVHRGKAFVMIAHLNKRSKKQINWKLLIFDLLHLTEKANLILCELPVGNKSIDLVALKKVRHQVYCIQVSATQYTVYWIKGYKMLKVVQRPLAIHIESLVTFSQIDGKIYVFEVLKTDKPGDQYYRKFEIKTVAYKII